MTFNIGCNEPLAGYFTPFFESDNCMREILLLAEPLLNSGAFQRLESITFLGVLSPSFNDIIKSPLSKKRSKRKIIDPGCRKSHSLGVAIIALDLTKRLGLSLKAQKYAIAWGLLHDIATWPLSHTGEPSFSTITHTSTNLLREMMITGSNRLPESLTVAKALKKMDIDPLTLLSLFNKRPSVIKTELQQLWQIMQSPVTPDSIEGTWRAGLAFGVDTPHPKDFQSAFSINLFFNIVLKKEQSRLVINFWRKKAKIYNLFINRLDVVLWESAWSSALKKYFHHLDLVDSLFITEDELITTVLKRGLPKSHGIFRYKSPEFYYVYPFGKRILYSDQLLLNLSNFLKKESKWENEYGRDYKTERIVRKVETIYKQQDLRRFFEGTQALY